MKQPRRIRALLTVGAMGAVVAQGMMMSPASATASEESCFTSAINSARGAAGVAPLAVNGDLLGIARPWSQTMASAGHIFHNTNLANVAPSNWMNLGENVGMGPTCDSIAQAFMNSPEHKRNILDPAFSTVGVGVVDTADGIIYVTEDFMGTGAAPAPASNPVVKPVATTPVPKAPASKAPAAPAPVSKAPAPAPAPAKVVAAKAPVKAATPAPAPATPAPAAPTPAEPLVDQPAAGDTLSVQGAPAFGAQAAAAPAQPKPHSTGLVNNVVSAIGSFFSHIF
jgi:hypothetical protein